MGTAEESRLRTLKQSLARTVLVDEDRREVCKRFRSRRRLARILDGARARREFETLRALSERGCNVPRPSTLRRAPQGWEVTMEWLSGTRSLERRLDSGRPLANSLADELGRLLASLHAAGLDHPDLHPGNVLVGDDERSWAIDFHSARLAGRLPSATLERDLLSLAASVRERVDARFRARFLRAWLRALAPAGAHFDAEWIERVEVQARARRRSVVAKRRLRWTRTGGACRRIDSPELAGYVRNGLELETLLDLARTSPRLACKASALGAGRHFAIEARDAPARLRETWYAAARLEEHRVPCARPLALLERPRELALFEWPVGALEHGTSTAGARALGFLLGTLHDRGLHASASPANTRVLASGALAIGPPEQLEHVDPRGPGREAELRAGYASALRGTRRERERWSRERSDG